jgi:hypothetical protein
VSDPLGAPREWITSAGEIAGFSGRVMAGVFSGRVLRFFGEALRQAGILILGSALVIWGLAFISACNAASRARTSVAPLVRPPTPASSRRGAICAR